LDNFIIKKDIIDCENEYNNEFNSSNSSKFPQIKVIQLKEPEFKYKGINREKNKLKKTEKKLLERLVYEEALSASLQNIVRRLSIKEALPELTKMLVDVLDVCRVSIYEYSETGKSGASLRLLNHSVKDGYDEEIIGKLRTEIKGDELSSPVFIKLKKLNHYLTHVKDFPQRDSSFLLPFNKGSIVLLPIAVNNKFRGFIRIDDCFSLKGWQDDDIRFLKNLTAGIGFAMEREDARKTIIDSLQEKELLLKEINHRVKNNLQIISSMLNIQARRISNEGIRNVFNDIKNRIGTIAFIHEMLYHTQSFSEIDFNPYVQKLTSNIFDSYSILSQKVSLELDIDDIKLDITKAIPCGLIINELVSNSLKHAFKKAKNGKIEVNMKYQENGNIVLIIKDDGTGIQEGINLSKTKSIGLPMVYNLTEQIDGNLGVRTRKGTEFIITFKR